MIDIEGWIEKTGERLSVDAKTILLNEGDVAKKMYVVKKGILRLFLYDSQGRDITFQFFFEGDTVASFNSMYYKEPSQFNLESIEQSELIAVDVDDLLRLKNSSPETREVFDQNIVERFRKYQLLFLSRIKNTPQELYEDLCNQCPDLIQRVPQHYIASYLGITPVSLSRIRRRRN